MTEWIIISLIVIHQEVTISMNTLWNKYKLQHAWSNTFKLYTIASYHPIIHDICLDLAIIICVMILVQHRLYFVFKDLNIPIKLMLTIES